MMKIENKSTWGCIIFLISLEQIIKVVINNYYLDKNFPILPPILYFNPLFNRDYSWLNSMLQLGVSKGLHIVLVAFISIFVFAFYMYLTKRVGASKIINVMFAFIFSGAICSLIDKVFWNGSLDYILLKGFFTFDLKDVYVNIFIGLIIFMMIFKNKTIKQIENEHLIMDFIKYLLSKA